MWQWRERLCVTSEWIHEGEFFDIEWERTTSSEKTQTTREVSPHIEHFHPRVTQSTSRWEEKHIELVSKEVNGVWCDVTVATQHKLRNTM
jgi:hypothetical protein